MSFWSGLFVREGPQCYNQEIILSQTGYIRQYVLVCASTRIGRL